MYGANVAVVEPHGLDAIDESERHGSPRDLFGLWFGANSETANFAVGILTVALYGTSLGGAIVGLLIGSVLGYTVVSLVSIAGPLDALIADLRVFPQKITNVRVISKPGFDRLPEVTRAYREAEAALGRSGRVVLRYSGTEPLARVMVEAEKEEDVARWSETVASALRSAIGA